MSYALITGASSGIGLELAKVMAEKQHNLILVARREDALQELKAQLQTSAINIEIRAMDLSVPGQARALHAYCQQQGYTVNYLINNAGFGDYGQLEASKLDIYCDMIQLNVMALTELTTLFADDMKQRQNGRILNVGSIAAFQPCPNLAVYAATKAYVMQFSEAINYELRKTGVTVTLLSPGPTKTAFFNRARLDDSIIAKRKLMTAHAVAMAGYKAMMAGKLNVIPGWDNQLLAFASKTMPVREVLLHIAGSLFKNKSATHSG